MVILTSGPSTLNTLISHLGMENETLKIQPSKRSGQTSQGYKLAGIWGGQRDGVIKQLFAVEKEF